MDDIYNNIYKYKQWVIKNPIKASELETYVKWGSYIIAGRFKNSSLLCEIVYAGSRIFELFNDFLVSGTIPKLTNEFNKLTVLLTVVEYLEVVIEVSAAQLWGETGRWAVVAIIQLCKAVWRLLLLLRSNLRMVAAPPIKPLDRARALDPEPAVDLISGFETRTKKAIVRLPRSGRLMRTLRGSPAAHLRTFSPPPLRRLYAEAHGSAAAAPSRTPGHLAAEILHIFRPIGHLASIWAFGHKSWVPWCFAFGIDLTSLHLHNQSVLTREEKRELVRRRLNLLYYLVRTPAFQAVTRRRLHQFLVAVGGNIPLAKTVCLPLLDYIPEWQKIYSHTWG